MEQTNLSVDQLLTMFNSTPQEVENQRTAEQTNQTQSTEVETDENANKPVDQLLEEQGITNPKEDENNPNSNPTVETLEESDLKGINLLIQEGKLFPLEDQNGNIIPIKTKQDLIELVDSNNEYFRNQAYQNLEQQVYQTKSPVWQTLLKYAEDARDISEIAPLFNVIQESYQTAQFDTTVPEDQENIIRMYGALQGLDENTIEEDITDLKERGKLEDRATKLKPTLDQYNEQRVQQVMYQKQVEEQQKAQYLQNYYNSVLENVIKPESVAGIRLTNEHKQLIASTLVPDPQIGGLPIYAIIDNLLQQGNFETLSKIALMATDPKSFDNYYSNRVGESINATIQKKLRTSHQSQNQSGSVAEDPTRRPKQVGGGQEQQENRPKFFFGQG